MNTAKSRHSATKKRQETLLHEYKQEKEGRVNRYMDRRFGEADENLSVEDRMMQRFKKEKMVFFFFFLPSFPFSHLFPTYRGTKKSSTWEKKMILILLVFLCRKVVISEGSFLSFSFLFFSFLFFSFLFFSFLFLSSFSFLFPPSLLPYSSKK